MGEKQRFWKCGEHGDKDVESQRYSGGAVEERKRLIRSGSQSCLRLSSHGISRSFSAQRIRSNSGTSAASFDCADSYRGQASAARTVFPVVHPRKRSRSQARPHCRIAHRMDENSVRLREQMPLCRISGIPPRKKQDPPYRKQARERCKCACSAGEARMRGSIHWRNRSLTENGGIPPTSLPAWGGR